MLLLHFFVSVFHHVCEPVTSSNSQCSSNDTSSCFNFRDTCHQIASSPQTAATFFSHKMQKSLHLLSLTLTQNISKWINDHSLSTELLCENIDALLCRLDTPSQTQILILNKAGLFPVLFQAWNSTDANREFVEALLRLVRLISEAITGGSGVMTGLRRRYSPINKIIVQFYVRMFESALTNNWSPLLHSENIRITKDFVTFLCDTLNVASALFIELKPFVPLVFMVKYFHLFPREVAKCVTIPAILKGLEQPRQSMIFAKLWWNNTDRALMLASNWKVQFYEQLVTSNYVHPGFPDLFGDFMLLIEPRHALFEVSLYFIRLFEGHSAYEPYIVSVIELRTFTISTPLEFERLREHEVTTALEFICKVLECPRESLKSALFYSEGPDSNDASSLKDFRDAMEELMIDNDSLMHEYTIFTQKLESLASVVNRKPIELTASKSLPSFLFQCVEQFFLNSTIINKSVVYSVVLLLGCDYLHSSFMPKRLISSLAQVLYYLDWDALRQALLAAALASEDENMVATYNWLGAKQNIGLFEKLIAYSYAELVAKDEPE